MKNTDKVITGPPRSRSQFQLLLRRFHALKNVNFEMENAKVTAFISPPAVENRPCDHQPHVRPFTRIQRAEGEILLNGENLSTRRLT